MVPPLSEYRLTVMAGSLQIVQRTILFLLLFLWLMVRIVHVRTHQSIRLQLKHSVNLAQLFEVGGQRFLVKVYSRCVRPFPGVIELNLCFDEGILTTAEFWRAQRLFCLLIRMNWWGIESL
jgi:hypothetical protein